jgi:hypothetical protein
MIYIQKEILIKIILALSKRTNRILLMIKAC